MSWQDETDEIHRRREAALAQGGPESVARHHAKGKLTVRERAAALLDEDSFDEVGRGAGAMGENGFEPANYLLGFGKIDGRRVVVGGEDFTMKGGSPSAAGFRKSVYAEDLALHRVGRVVILRPRAQMI